MEKITKVKTKYDKLKAGHCLKTVGGDYHFILKVGGTAFIQDAFDGKWSSQSNNEGKDTVVHVWTGRFYQKISLSELDEIYSEILKPENEEIEGTFIQINEQD